MAEELGNQKNRGYAGQGRAAGDRQVLPIQRSLIWGGLAGTALIAGGWSLTGLGFMELALLAGLAVICLAPMFQWYRRGMRWIPLGEIYVLMCLVYYVLPCLSGRQDWLSYPEAQRLATLAAVGLFLVTMIVVYRGVLRSSWLPLELTSLLRREVRPEVMWGLFGLWVVWSLLAQSNALPDLADYFNVFHATVSAAGTVGMVYLLYREGQKKLVDAKRVLVIGGVVLGLATNIASGYLSFAAKTMGAALLAFTLGRRQVPVGAVALSVALLAILQLGKLEFRTVYWAKNSQQKVGLVDGYKTWFNGAWKTISKQNGPETQGLLERTSLVQILALAVATTPEQQPFLRGQTYAMLPGLMMPRVFWPDKPRGSLPSETIGIYYGIQTEKGAATTSISVGPLVEAWANFGWFGIVAAAAFLGLLFGFFARVSRALEARQIGWLLASIPLIYCTDLEHCIPETCSSMVPTLFMGFIFLWVVSRPATFLPLRRPLARQTAKPVPAGEPLTREDAESV